MFRRPKKVRILGSSVLITGGGSGIGRLMAVECAKRGAKAVVVWNRKVDAGEETVAQIAKVAPHCKAKFYSVDVTDPAAVQAAAQEVLAEFGHIDVLINNAGVVNGKPILELTEAEIARTLDVNTLSLWRTVREFLPGMIERDYGSVVTISSAAGLVGVAKQSDYNASKFGAVGFAQSLRAELRHRGSNVHTLLYCPYYINTGMFEGVTTRFSKLLPILEQEDVALQIVDAVEKGTQMKVNPPIVRLVQLLHPFPVPFVDLMLDIFGINSTMDHFAGRPQGSK